MWDISQIDFSTVQKGEHRDSPSFWVPGLDLRAWIRYFPKGEQEAKDGNASVYLRRNTASKIEFDLLVGSVVRHSVHTDGRSVNVDELPSALAWGWMDCMREGQHPKIQVILKAAQLPDGLICRYD